MIPASPPETPEGQTRYLVAGQPLVCPICKGQGFDAWSSFQRPRWGWGWRNTTNVACVACGHIMAFADRYAKRSA
ncbi:MAG: hypothetical protein V4510_03085 [bacterium]